MSSKHSGKSKISTTVKNKRSRNIYEEFRPHSGIRYDLDQTEADINAGYTKIKLQHTTVEYEPGQNLSPPAPKKIRYARQRNRGPVWIFKEELERRECERRAKEIAVVAIEKMNRKKITNEIINEEAHKEVMLKIGPKWFHELAPSQMENVDTLQFALKQDRKYKCIKHTVEKLIGIGLVLLPNHTKVEHCIEHYHNCPTEFLLKIFQLTHDAEKKDVYTLNDRILLTCITHLALRQTLRELHLRIPSPPREETQKKRRRFSFEIELKKQRKMKFKSPYTKPTIFIPQLHKHEIYMNRHKEYASSEYFDYVDDMYNITYKEVVKTPTKGIGLENSKYSKPPKIKVRQMQSKIERRKIYKLKKPSQYVSPCEIIFKEPEPEPEPEPNICNCTPSSFNKDTAFELKIKITTSHEEMTFTQTLCPYNQDCAVDELKLKDYCVIDCDQKLDENQTTGFKKIEYTCECNACKKPVNIISDNLNTFSVYNNQPQNVTFDSNETSRPKAPDVSKVCECPSLDSNNPCEDKGDNDCDCTSKTEECTCCICAENQDFLTKLKIYNDMYNTNVKPCLCACKCKKHRRKPCCLSPLEAEQNKCKYCFCNKIRRRPDIPMPEDDDEVVVLKEKPESSIESEDSSDVIVNTKNVPHEVGKTIMKTDGEHKKDDQGLTFNSVASYDSEESVCEECKCAKMYDEYLLTHDSCIDLFLEYQSKMKKDLEDYLKDLEERCICGDSLSNIEEESIVHDSSSCSCLKATNKPEYKSSSSDDNRCDCDDDDSVELNKCQCPPKRKLMGTPTCDYGRAQLEGITKSERMEDFTETSQLITNGTTKKISNITSSASSLKSEAEEEEEKDSRIFSLKKLPRTKKGQLRLLKKVLNSLAEDGYPLAQLPDVHLLPIFKLWFDKRNNRYISMEERAEYTKRTTKILTHIYKCKRFVRLPKLKWQTNEQMQRLKWDKVYTYQKYVYSMRNDFNRRFKQAIISMAQENFPTHFTYQLPNKNFRDCYFAYMPADENHAYVFKPWQVHEVRKRKNTT